MKKWSIVQTRYTDISIVNKFHRHSMHLKSNLAIQAMKKVDYKKYKKIKNNERIPLRPVLEYDVKEENLYNILEKRRTSWSFEKDMGEEEMSMILQRSFGVTLSKYFNEFLVHLRAYASAGAMYAIKPMLYVNKVDDKFNGTVFEFLSETNELYFIRKAPLKEVEELTSTTKFHVKSFNDAKIIFFFVLDLEPLFAKYGALSYRLGLLEAGHMCTTCQLVATSLGYNTVPIGGFYDLDVNNFLLRDTNEYCLYMLAVG